MLGYNYLETDDLDEDDNGDPIYVKNIKRSLTHTLRFEIAWSFMDGNLTIENDYAFTRVVPYDKSIEDSRDFKLSNDLSIDYEINDHMSFTWKNSYDFDDRRRKEQGIDSVNHINTFSLSFNWSPN